MKDLKGCTQVLQIHTYQCTYQKKKKNLSMHIYIQEKLKLVLKTQRQHPFS